MQEINYPQIRSSEVRWEWIGQAWKLFTSAPTTWILMLLTCFVLIVICTIPISMIVGFATFSGRDFEEPVPRTGLGAMPIGVIVPVVLLYIVMILVMTFLLSGFYRTAIKQSRGQAISVADLFSGRDRFLSVFGYQILILLSYACVYGIFYLPALIVPGIEILTFLAGYLVVFLINASMFFAIPLIVDRRAGVLEAMRKSFELTRSNLIMYAIFIFVVALLSLVGLVGCGIGVLVTIPFLITVPAVAYRDVIGLPGAQNYDQFVVPPPPNYSTSAPQEQLVSATQPQDQVQKPVVCPSCGATLLRATNFCNQCGSKL